MTKDSLNKSSIVYILALSQFAAPFMFSGVGIALPVMGRELHASGVELGLIEIIYLGAASAFLLPIGHFSDLTDRNTIFKMGTFLYALTTLILGFLSSIPLIILLRFIQGCAAALVMSTNMAILTDVVPREKLGKAIGFNIGAVYLGLSAGPFIAGWITSTYGWRWVFHFTFFPLLLSFCIISFNLKSNWNFPKINFDWMGSAAIVITVFLLISGSAMLGESAIGYILCGAGIAFGFLFFVIEKRSSHPLIDLVKIRKNVTLSMALLIQLFMYAGAFGISFLFSLYLQTVKGLSAQSAGQIMVISPVIMAIFAPICGRLADKFPPGLLAVIGLVSSLISVLAATQVTADTSLAYLIGVLILQGFGFAMFSSPNMAIIMGSVKPNEFGIASALSAKMRSLGMAFSMMIITVFMSIYLGHHMITTHKAEFLLVMRGSFIVFSLFAAAGTYISLRNSPMKKMPSTKKAS